MLKIYHPAVFSDSILRHIANSSLLPLGIILDPFAGTGKVHQLAHSGLNTVGLEIEPEWAGMHPRTLLGDALHMPFRDQSFDGVVTSPVYGNRMSDSHKAKDPSLRRSYTHDMRRSTGDPDRRLHSNNAGTLYAWGKTYWQFHRQVWKEVARVIKPGGVFLLNVSDCYRNRELVHVTDRHIHLCLDHFMVEDTHEVQTPRMKYGRNGEARVEAEIIVIMRRRNAST